MLERREWREGYLAERMRDEILLDQIMIDTEGECIGQINALSVIEFPGHPRAFGEPSRISCVVISATANLLTLSVKLNWAVIFTPKA